MMRRNSDENLRDLERQALHGGPEARRRYAVALERSGRGSYHQIKNLLDIANATTDEENIRRGFTVGRDRGDVDFGRLTLEDVAQIAAAVLTVPSVRKSLPEGWPQTAFAWATGLSRGDVIPDEQFETVDSRTFRTHAIVVALPDGSLTVAIAPTSLTDRRGDPRNFAYYTPSAEPTDAWPDILSEGYIGVGLMGDPTVWHYKNGMGETGPSRLLGPDTPEDSERRSRHLRAVLDGDPLVGGESPTESFFSWGMRRDMVYEWARRPAPDRIRTTAEALQVFVDMAGAREPAWW